MAVEISEASCRHRCTVLTGRSLRVVTGESSETDCVDAVLEEIDRDGQREEHTFTMVSVSSQSLKTCSNGDWECLVRMGWAEVGDTDLVEKGHGGWERTRGERGRREECMQATACFFFDRLMTSYVLQIVNGVPTCIPLQIPRTDSDVLSTIRPFFNGLILAPDDSSMSCTFRSIPFTSSRCNGITLSRRFTGGRSAVRASERADTTDRKSRARWVRGRCAA